MSARTNVTYSTPVSIPHSEKFEQLALRFDEESPYDPANAIPDFDHARNTWHHLTPKRIEQFWASVDKSGGDEACWNWKQATTYGEYYLGTHKERTHRLAYNLSTGQDIPAGMEVCHTCDNPKCCNPQHLWLGTNAENIEDMRRKGRARARRGASNKNAKLLMHQAREVRRPYSAGGVSQQAIADALGVTQRVVSLIVRNVSYKEL